ncbi:MAG: autotransporter outer membrane beta-barrel domain-containing protein [Cyanobacteriota bacterium]|nr:autotransporter outer membrane beta-barrel domain-containing protein [Cyanobacteriota bacterium]
MTNDNDSAGIILQSIGMGGGIGGKSSAKNFAVAAGTFDPELSGIPTLSTAFSLGGSGGSGGKGGAVNYWHTGTIATYGGASHGLMAQSIGGGGGSGGDGTASAHAIGSSVATINLSFGLGGSAGSGTDGGDTWLQIGTAGTPGTATIQTTGHDSMAVLAQSTGGGGGNAGTGSGLRLSVSYKPTGPDSTAAAAKKAVASGSAGDSGEEFAAVGASAAGSPTTDGDGGLVFETSAMQCLKAIPASAAGGQVGTGCGSGATTSSSKKAKVKLEINVGRNGGGGGSGGSVTVQNNGALSTTGSGSTGILGQSVGGGGGKATAIGPHASGGLLNVSIAVGGSGGSGGVGGAVSVINQGTGNPSTASATQTTPGGWIRTGLRYDLDNPMEQDATKFTSPAVTGGDAHGIHAQSIGGGGGIGGNADPQNSAVSSSMVADLVKGKNKTAELKALGIGDDVFSDVKSAVKLLRWGLKGISPVNLSFRPSISVGGAGGTGGDGGSVTIGNYGNIETFGHRSYGVFGQSIGGGGGTGGASSSPLIDLAGSQTLQRIDFSPSINVGGNGGAAGNGGSVTVTTGPGNAGAISNIITHGYAAIGIAAQSIGGGGGTAHEGSTFGLSDRIGANGTLSVTGGVDFGNGQSEATYNATAATATANGSLSFGSQSTKSSYGSSGNGGLISLGTSVKPMQGNVITHGDDAMAVFGQSLGGGGGLASLGCSNSSPVKGDQDASACWGNTTVEGSTGQPGRFVGAAGAGGIAISVNGGSGSQIGDNIQAGSAGVTIFDGQQITTYGARSMGMVSQSISGGGGFFSGPNRRINSVSMPVQPRTSTPAGGNTINLNGSSITTYGDGSWGVLAQTIKGGGGFFGDPAQELAFNLKYDVNKPAAPNVLAGETPNPTPKFGQNRVGDPRWNVGGCENTPTCSITSLNPGTVYKIPFSQGSASWAPGDYLTLEPSNDSGYPYVVNQYSSTGALKTSLGKGRILNISANAFLLEGNDRNTGQVYGSNTLIAGPMTIAGVAQPNVDQANQYLLDYYTAPNSTVNTVFLASSDGWSPINPILYPGLLSTAAPPPSTMSVSMVNSNVTTHGRNAHGMVLQNLGSVGGAWSADGTPLNLGITMTGSSGLWLTPGGNVNLTMNASSINALGPRSRGVIIQSDGAGPGGAGGRGQISVSLQNKSLIYADQHTALMLVGGSYNTAQRNKISVDGTSSIQNGAYMNAGTGSTAAIDDSDSSYNKWAVYAPAGYTNLEVAKGGSIYGNILLGITTRGDFTNQGDWHGSAFTGANQSLHNYGRIFAGGAGTTSRLHIDGSLKHHRGGEIHIDVHPAGQAAPHDALRVTGLAQIEGTIVPQTQSLMPGGYEVLQGGSLAYSGDIRDSHVFDWQERVENNTLVKTPHADFTPAGFALNRSQRSLARYLQRAWETSESSHAYTFGYLHEHESGAHTNYRATLTQLSGQVLNSQAVQMKTSFTNILGQGLACPNDNSAGTTLGQGNCIWAEAIGSIADQSDQDSSPSFRAEAAGMRLGGQKQLRNQWQAGFSFGYANNTLTATGFNSSGTFADASVSAQKSMGSWALGGSLALAQGWFDNTRKPQLFGNDAAASLASTYRSDSSMTIFGMRLRAAHTTVLKTSTIKPTIDLDLSFNHQPGYDETGDLLALSAKTSQQFNVAITPMLEFGFNKLRLGDLKLEGFVSAGASILPTNSITTRMSFSEASSANGSFDAVTNGPPLLGRVNLGLQLYKGSVIEARAEYGLQAGSGYWDQRVGAKLLYRF